MNIMMIEGGDKKYGAAHSLYDLAAALQKRPDVNVTMVTNRRSTMINTLKDVGCKVVVIRFNPFILGYPGWREYWRMPLAIVRQGIRYYYGCLFAEKQLQKAVRIEEFDLIHTNTSINDFGALLAGKYHIPQVWHIREFGDLDYKYFSYRNDNIALMNRTASVMIAVSDAVRAHWIGKGIDSGKIVSIYDGIRPISAPKAKPLPIGQKREIRLVMTGSIQPTKGQEQAIKLMARLKNKSQSFHLDLIGDGSKVYLRHLGRMVREYQVEDTVSFLGYRTDVPALLPEYDVGLVCSRSEAFGRVTVEYMMAGLPVLASDTGANPELIREGVDGHIYSYGDIQDMATKLLKMVEENLGGTGTRLYALDNFSDSVNAEKVYQIYQKILWTKSV